MTAPNQGPCVCDVEEMLRQGGEIRPEGEIRVTKAHEHAEFEPYACADCDCEGFRPAGSEPEAAGNRPHSPGDGQTPHTAGDRPHLTIPAVLDFSAERVHDTAQHLDQIITQIRGTFTDPDDPLAVCALADMLEATWPDTADSWVALVLATRRLIDATNHGRRTRQAAAFEAFRRKVQR